MAEETVKIQANEDIVDDLTKDLQNTQFETAQVDKSETPTTQDIDNDSDSDTEKSKDHKKPVVLEDSDDEFLKNQEIDLTDEEKEVKRKDAIELKNRGNEEFKQANYSDSIDTYTKALSFCPLKFSEDRAILYANRAASRSKVGDRENAIRDCTKALELNDKYIKAYLRRAKFYEETEKLDESLEDYKKILEFDPGNKDALVASCRLPPLINERNEKLKTEMLGKLKDLGNLFLRPFGLSTNNFNLQQDPNSGSYSMNFQQNADG